MSNPPFMMNTDMAIIRDFEGDGKEYLLPNDKVECSIKDQWTSTKRCPWADTLSKAGVYRDSNDTWLSDFRKVLIAMLEKGLSD